MLYFKLQVFYYAQIYMDTADRKMTCRIIDMIFIRLALELKSLVG
ncbi:MAG: hypothetical protein ACXWV6_13400 [Chitinophagaceae bacterium]